MCRSMCLSLQRLVLGKGSEQDPLHLSNSIPDRMSYSSTLEKFSVVILQIREPFAVRSCAGGKH